MILIFFDSDIVALATIIFVSIFSIVSGRAYKFQTLIQKEHCEDEILIYKEAS